VSLVVSRRSNEPRARMSKEVSYLEAIREALLEEMRRDPKVFILGEDVGAYGGAFGVTQGLHEEFGDLRVVDTPISESAIVGISVGAALRGYRPVAEMQFADFISCAFDQIVNQAATLRYRYGGRASVPIVIRAPSGGNVGGGLYHSQNPEAWFVHRPGLRVVAPSTAFDAKGLIKAAVRDDNQAILASVDKTGRVLIVHEDVKTLGLGAELSALIMEERFDSLDAPVQRVTAPDTHAPFSQVLEKAVVPDAPRIVEALRRLA